MKNNADKVAQNLNAFASNVDKACMSQINKATTVLQQFMLDDMASQIPIPKSRLKKQISRLSPASVQNMRSGVLTKHRPVQMRNVPHHATEGGVSVQASTSGGYKTIRDAYIGKTALKGNGIRGYIAMPVGSLIRTLQQSQSKSELLPARIASLKAYRARAKAKNKDKKSSRNKSGDYAMALLYVASEAQMAHDIKKYGKYNTAVGLSFRDGFMLKLKGL